MLVYTFGSDVVIQKLSIAQKFVVGINSNFFISNRQTDVNSNNDVYFFAWLVPLIHLVIMYH